MQKTDAMPCLAVRPFVFVDRGGAKPCLSLSQAAFRDKEI
ncbi:hypothetical protein CHK_1941 [Christensenella hongkongensis]|uniref:Uncharacterized protein n=1 Tax=Christensenella hongkongensis TaxID=270498 RepID=A0A0M2NJN8_9FIRM|nr:hypothetical protein CHK_1941 [Christensenella hongkongensis]